MTGLLSRRSIRLAALLAAGFLLLCGCDSGRGGDVLILLDGAPWDGGAIPGETGGGLRVYLTLDGAPLIDLPFGEERTVSVVQNGVGENTVAITRDAVFMAHADCENQDCVTMGAVTRENLELRPLGGFIICLPHRFSVEVRGE